MSKVAFLPSYFLTFQESYIAVVHSIDFLRSSVYNFIPSVMTSIHSIPNENKQENVSNFKNAKTNLSACSD